MQHRGVFLGLALSLLAIGSAAAQEPNRRGPRRSVDTGAAYMGGGMVIEAAPVLGRRPQQVVTRTELAPVPNSRIEAPRGFQQAEVARFTPGVIAPIIPGRGLAQENGSPGSLQDRLFRPAPGAHLRIPLSW